MSLAEAKERIRMLEATVGEAPGDQTRDLVTTAAEHEAQIGQLRAELAAAQEGLQARLDSQPAELGTLLAGLSAKVQTLEDEVALLRRAVGRPQQPEAAPPSKVRVPEPKPFSGNRDAKELENFIWDLEKYFKAARIQEAEHVNLASMFLAGDAKLWWRTREADDRAAGRPGVANWPAMRQQLKDQFLPHNTAWMAREALKKLRHTGSVREYVKAFSSLMLDIHNMSEEDKLFNFMSGLQPWAQAELRRQGVKDIPAAMASAEGLADFRTVSPTPFGDKKVAPMGRRLSAKGDKKKKKPAVPKREATRKAATVPSAKQGKTGGCFTCGGPHMAKDCPKKKEKVNALTMVEDDDSDGAEEDVSRVNPLQLLNALTARRPPPCRELLYVTVLINGREARAMLDTGATHNFVAKDEAARLGLKVSNSTNLIKAVNSQAVQVHGLAEAAVRAGAWQGTCGLMVIPLDDFGVILGLEFFMAAKAMVVPYLRGIFIGDEKGACFITSSSTAGQESPTARAQGAPARSLAQSAGPTVPSGRTATSGAANQVARPTRQEGAQDRATKGSPRRGSAGKARAGAQEAPRTGVESGTQGPGRSGAQTRAQECTQADVRADGLDGARTGAQGGARAGGPSGAQAGALEGARPGARPEIARTGAPSDQGSGARAGAQEVDRANGSAALPAARAPDLTPKQVSKGVRRGLVTFVAALVQVHPDFEGKVPKEVGAVLEEFADTMPAELPACLPPRREVDHKIELEPGARPPAKAPYRMSPAELAELRRQLDALLEAGLIQPSKAPYGAPVLFQKKQDGTLRMCVDYRALNKVTIKNKYPVPNAADLFDRLAKASFFTKLDLKSGYWQVRIAAGDESKTTCVTRYGSYEFLVMPFGLTNAPATFCNLMTNVLYDFLDKFVVVYLDDIVVYSRSLEEHVGHLKQVFSRLREHQLFLNKTKCEFAREEIKFLGHWVGHASIRMDEGKVRAIVEWPAPTSVAELRSFLGLANYYRRFIRGYSKEVSPLTDLLKKDRRWEWSETCQAAFENLKLAVSMEPVLRLPDFDVPFEVHTDASDRALGGVLVQQGHPVAYESRKFRDAEQRYSAHEKEMTAVIHCLETWRHYLLGTRFTVVTDNVANTYFRTQKKLTPKQARWQEYLAEFDFVWVHRPGRQNLVADALSRQEVQAYVGALTALQTDFMERVQRAAQTDQAYARLQAEVRAGRARRFWLDRDMLWAKGGRLYVPRGAELRLSLLKETHDTPWAGHPGVDRMYALLSQTYYWPRMYDDVEAYVRSCLTCQQDKVERRRPAGLLQPLPVPAKPWASISLDFVGGFPEVRGMSSIFVVVDRFSKYAVFMAAPRECPAETAASLFFSNVVKYFGIPGDIISDRDARFTGRFWTNLFQLMGSELKFSTAYHPQTDGQTERVNAMLEEYLRHYATATQRNWLDLLDTAQFSYNLHRTSATGATPAEVCLGFQPMAPAHVGPRTAQGQCPAAHKFARDRSVLIAEAHDSLIRTAWRMKLQADKHRRPLEFAVGDMVMLKLPPHVRRQASKRRLHKGLMPRYEGPFKVLRRVGPVAYRLELPARLKVHPVFHISFLKPFHADPDPAREQTVRDPPAAPRARSKEIERILAHRRMGSKRRGYRTEFLVHWKGEDLSDAVWEKEEELWRYEKQIEAYRNSAPTRASASSGGGGLSHPPASS